MWWVPVLSVGLDASVATSRPPAGGGGVHSPARPRPSCRTVERGIVNGRFTIGDFAKKSPEGRPDDIHLLFTHWLWEFGGSVRYQAKEVIRVGDPFGCVLEVS